VISHLSWGIFIYADTSCGSAEPIESQGPIIPWLNCGLAGNMQNLWLLTSRLEAGETAMMAYNFKPPATAAKRPWVEIAITLQVYPNPCRSGDLLKLNLSTTAQHQYCLYDLLGRVVKTGTVSNTGLEIPRSLPTGNYFLRVQVQGQGVNALTKLTVIH
jgi:hypothetical protein